MKKSDEIKKVINALTDQVKAAQEAEEMDKAAALADELTTAVNEYKSAKAVEDAEMETFTQTAAPVKTTPVKADAHMMNRIFNKLVLGRAMSEDEKAIYADNRAAFNIPGTPGQVEATPGKGGYLVPVEEMNIFYEYKKALSNLRDYCNVFAVNRPTGRFPAAAQTTATLTSFEELNAIHKTDFDFSQITFSITDYGDIVPISQNLIEDADFSIMSIIGARLAREAVNTENSVILSAIATELSSPTTITTYKQLLKALNVTLDRAFYANTRIFCNQDAFQWLSTLEDGMNRPLLVPDVAAPDTYRFKGKEVVVIPNGTLATDTSGTDHLAPIYVGSMADFIGFFERKGIEIATSNEFMFDKNAVAMRAIMRFGVSVLDDAALVALNVKVN